MLISNAGVFAARRELLPGKTLSCSSGSTIWDRSCCLICYLPAPGSGSRTQLVNVASRAILRRSNHFDDLRGEKHPYRGWRAYARSKLANVLFTREWNRRFPGIPANCLHPGTLRTTIGNKHSPGTSR